MHTIFFRKTPLRRALHSSSVNKIGELCILRHAKSEHNEQGCCAGYYNASQLTQEGIKTTLEVGKLLAQCNMKFERLYVSPLQRALITARILLNNLPPIKIEAMDALVERNFGAFTGMSKIKIKEQLTREVFDRYIYDRKFLPPDIGPQHPYFQSEKLYGTWPLNHKAESYQCVINRLTPFLEQIKTELLNGHNILIVGHSHNLQILQMLLYGGLFECGIEKYKIEHVTPIKFTFACHSDNQLVVTERINVLEAESLSKISSPC